MCGGQRRASSALASTTFPGLSARRILSAVLLLFALIAAGCAGEDERGTESGSTLVATLVDRDGDGFVERGPPESLLERTELASFSRETAQLALFAQITDAQLTDEESPARLEMLDRLGTPFTSAFRPHEALLPHVLTAAVRTLNRLAPQAVVLTGDLIDNGQGNELEQALAILRGGKVDPGSGARRYEGVQAASNPDPFLYRPDVDPPRLHGVLGRAQRPFRSPGLRAPWYPLVGNHDLLVQGNLAPTPEIRRVATGERKLVRLNEVALDLLRSGSLMRAPVDRLLAQGLPGDSIAVTPDPTRRLPGAGAIVGRLRAASHAPRGGLLLDYVFDIGPSVLGVALDTVRRDAGAGGILRPRQTAWLRRELARAGERAVVVFSSTPLTDTEGGEAALALLDRDPRVVAAVSGDKHRNAIRPRRTGAGGYWLIATSSLADFPQQARAFRLVRTAGGGLALETWMLDHDPGSQLAASARQLAHLDFQGGRPAASAGEASDRNARLFLPPPSG